MFLRCSLSLIPFVFATAQAVGSLSGTVRSDDGSPLVNTRVVVQLRAPGMQPLVRAADTEARGTFTFTGLPAGIYEICAMPKAPGYFNSCASSNTAERLASVRAGETVTAPAITVHRTASLQVTVDDPADELAKASSRLVLQVVVPGYPPVPLTLTQSPGTRRVFEAPVPRGISVKLFARSIGFTMADSRATALPADYSQDVSITDSTLPAIGFVIRGRP